MPEIQEKSGENVFDYELLARKNNVDQEILDKIIEEVYKEFPNDQMLAELHVVRALKKYIESDSK